MASPVVCAYLNLRVSNDPALDWLTWSLARIGLQRRQGVSVLVLGCGEGWLERAIADRAEIASIDACDVSPLAVAAAANAARAAAIDKIRYHVVDLNCQPPPPPPAGIGYDLIIAHSVLHHVENLERCFPAIASALAPQGWVLINEYAGPRRFQFGEAQMAVLNRLFGRLPERLRRSSLNGAVPSSKAAPSEADVVATDPSEAVRADELPRFTRESFAVEAEIAYGGTLLGHLLYDVVQNFDPRSARENRLLALLCFVEDALLAERRLPSDFTVTLARPRGARATGARAPVPTTRRARALRAWELAVISAMSEDPTSSPGELRAAPRAPRLSLATRPDRQQRHGLERPALRAAVNARATGDAEREFASWALARERPGRLAAARPQRALVACDSADPWAERLGSETQVGPVDRLEPRWARTGALEWTLAAGPGGGESSLDPGGAGVRYTRAFTNGWLGRAAEHRTGTISRLAGLLAPGGLLIGDDYLGRPDNRPTDSVRFYAEELLDLLQPANAGSPRRWGLLGTRLAAFRDRCLRWWNPYPEGDSAEIVTAVLGPAFRLRWARSTGGALLQRLLQTAAEALDTRDSVDAAFVQVAADLEELLEESGVLPCEYVAFVAERVD